MKYIFLVTCLFLLSGFTVTTVMGEDASVQMGEKLFNDPTLGGSGNPMSCNSCHPGGQGLEKAAANSDLAQIINYCIEKPMKGNTIDRDSVEMQSLVLYIKSLQK